jgi:hypothetical protein
METRRKEAFASSVFVEFFDVLGNSLAQAAFLQWRGKPLPDVGDSVCCAVAHSPQGQAAKMTGRVRCRHFEVQTSANGAANVLVRLTVDVASAGGKPARHAAPASPLFFSQN